MINHFGDHELECHCDRCKGRGTARYINSLFHHRLNLLRDMWGDYIYVSDAYRCPEHNAEVGGVPHSVHTQGLAADIYVGDKYDFGKEAREEYERFYQFVLNSKLFDGVGHYKNGLFAHVDLRDWGDSPNEYQWEG